METRPLTLVAIIAAATALSGCAASSTPFPAAGQSATARTAIRDAAGKQRTLFVADVDSNVLLYPANINQMNPPLLGEITQGVTRSVGVCIGNATLYVVNSPDGLVSGAVVPINTATNRPGPPIGDHGAVQQSGGTALA